MHTQTLDIELVEKSGDDERGLRQAQPSKHVQIKYLVRLAFCMLSLIVIISCGNWGWEAIDTDNKEKLNIFGLISLDDSLSSFVIVHKTLDTAGPDQEIVGYDTIYFDSWEWFNDDTGMFVRDTFWYETPYIRPIRESLYVVKDATVIISDGSQDYTFVRSPNFGTEGEGREDYWYDDVFSDHGVYVNTDGSFSPTPNTEYSLSVTTPGGHNISGSTITPVIPRIKVDQLEDTLSLNSLFELNWHYDGEFNTTITSGFASQDWEKYVCGMRQFGLTEPGDTTWTSTIDSWCLESVPNEEVFAPMDIRLRYLDENYYRYFIATDDEVENISNFLIGEGSIGTAYGVDGGFGVFGSFSADWVNRYATP
ncbi:MAG: DUF4249 family protein [Candidatus Marinimicrobia bacterium]|jgi:hypothetical protein|nr:DUF4249 family protein [Candidatus Neomarinimicrobiota bacterium]MBT6001514.1 DUF4249 family protein [Candidatus Neomarinimicrobiota bacterium]MBT6760122.1 DUF4249 family protein [Candidatus Neomarinimicrobiota bacterium]